MNKFFSKILKNKKILFLIAFVFVITFAIPQVAFATWFKPWTWGSTFLDAIINGGVTLGFAIPIFIVVAAAAISKTILTLVVAFALAASYTHDTSVNIGWPIVRDLANMMVVLGFVVIGIAFALRIESYGSKKVLINLIIAALLINFSLLICGVFIDATNIIMDFFLKNSSPASSWIPNIGLGDLIENIGQKSAGEFTSVLIGIVFFNFIGFFVYMLYAVLILARVVALWILVILSPLAFVCFVFPATKNIWQMWWKNFSQWCIIVLPLGLFYYIGWKIIDLAASSNNVVNVNLSSNQEMTLAQFLSNSVSTILAPALFLVVGFFVSLQFAPAGASAIMNFANKNKGKAMSGGLGVLNKAHMATTGKLLGAAGNKLSQLSAAKGGTGVIGKGAGWMAAGANALANPVAQSRKTRSAIGHGLEALGAQHIGTQALVDQKRVEEEARFATAAYTSGRPEEKARIENIARNGTGVERAGAIQAIAGEKELHKVFKDASGNADLGAIDKAIKDAEGYGASDNIRKNAIKKMPALAAKDEKALGKIAEQYHLDMKKDKDRIENEAVTRAFSKMAPEDMDIDVVKSVNNSVIESAGPRLSGKQKEQLRTLIAPLREQLGTMDKNDPGHDNLQIKIVNLNRASKQKKGTDRTTGTRPYSVTPTITPPSSGKSTLKIKKP